MNDIAILCQFLSALVKDILKSNGVVDLRPHFRLFSGLIGELAVGSTVRNMGHVEYSDLSDSYFSSNVADGLERIVTKSDSLEFLSDTTSGYIAFVTHSYGFVLDENTNGERISLDNVQVVCALVGALSACSPTSCANFAFSWLQLISDRELMPTLLCMRTSYGWPLFRHLILKMVSYLCEFLTEPEKVASSAVQTLYAGLLRVLLVLLHDFSEFLCSYHMDLVDCIPACCVQLRNLVLASFPKAMRLPDPFLPDLNVDDLPEMLERPLIMSDYVKHLRGNGAREMLDDYLGNNGGQQRGVRERSSGLDMKVLLKWTRRGKDDNRKEGEEGEYNRKEGEEGEYDIKRIWAVVMYVGQHAINNNINNVNDEASELLKVMVRDMDMEGRHHMLNGIANQLRYPNTNTMYYSRLVLVLFNEADNDIIKEQITRVLVERLIANRPHPWGLLITFVQLIKNNEYNFWDHGFVRCVPEIEQLFQNVAKFCVGPALQQQQQQQQQMHHQHQHEHEQQNQQQSNNNSSKTPSLLAAS